MKFLKNKAFLLASAFVIAAAVGTHSVAFQFGSGSMNTDEQRHRQLLWSYNADVVAHEDGDVVVWNDGSIQDGVEIETTTTANNGLVAGVVLGDIAATSWGWVQTHGYHDSITVGTVSAGDSLVTSTTGEQAAAYTIAQATGTAANEGAIFGVFGVALAADSGGVAPGFIIR